MGSTGGLTKFGHAMNEHFLFEPKYKNLNHGSFGTYPRSVRTVFQQYQALAEACPDKFNRYTYSALLDRARASVSKLLNLPIEECVFVQNASSGVGVVLRNLQYKKGDAIIYFDTVYGACEKLIASLIETVPNLTARKVNYDLPCTHDVIVNNFVQLVGHVRSEGLNPKVALFDTVVSMPGVRFPFSRLTMECKKAGILSCIDGAHGVGHIPLDLQSLDADFFVSNCHKWLYTPRGCAVFHVPRRNQHLIRTTYPTSHGFRPTVSPDPLAPIRNPLPPDGKPPFVSLFQFVATTDNAPYYCVPEALRFRGEVCGGEEKICNYIRDMAQHGADRVAAVLGTSVMDDGMDWRKGQGGLRDCALANIKLPLPIDVDGGVSMQEVDEIRNWMELQLIEKYNGFACIYDYKGELWARVSGQIYLELSDFEWLGGVLQALCTAVMAGEHRKTQRSRL